MPEVTWVEIVSYGLWVAVTATFAFLAGRSCKKADTKWQEVNRAIAVAEVLLDELDSISHAEPHARFVTLYVDLEAYQQLRDVPTKKQETKA